MEAKDTVMTKAQLRALPKIDRDSVLLAQAEFTWDKAKERYLAEGRQEVVEFINNSGRYSCGDDYTFLRFGEAWQAKLKSWFKDNPELLKEWGISEDKD